MPIHRFRSFDEAQEALWTDSRDPALAERMRRLWGFAARLSRRRRVPGLKRFASIEEANLDRERSEAP